MFNTVTLTTHKHLEWNRFLVHWFIIVWLG